jgi:hypothetical protein
MKELTLNDIGSIANEKQVVRAVKRKRKKATVENLSKRTNKVRSAKTAGEKKRRIPTDEPDTDDIPLTIIKMEPPPLDRFNDDSDNYFDWSPNKLYVPFLIPYSFIFLVSSTDTLTLTFFLLFFPGDK